MKKFLSILLALAVGFTFTFGSAMSAFADESTGKWTPAEVKAEIEAEVTAQKTLVDNYASIYLNDGADINYTPDAKTINLAGYVSGYVTGETNYQYFEETTTGATHKLVAGKTNEFETATTDATHKIATPTVKFSAKAKNAVVALAVEDAKKAIDAEAAIQVAKVTADSAADTFTNFTTDQKNGYVANIKKVVAGGTTTNTSGANQNTYYGFNTNEKIGKIVAARDGEYDMLGDDPTATYADLAKAEFDVIKAAELGKLDKVDPDKYSDTLDTTDSNYLRTAANNAEILTQDTYMSNKEYVAAYKTWAVNKVTAMTVGKTVPKIAVQLWDNGEGGLTYYNTTVAEKISGIKKITEENLDKADKANGVAAAKLAMETKAAESKAVVLADINNALRYWQRQEAANGALNASQQKIVANLNAAAAKLDAEYKAVVDVETYRLENNLKVGTLTYNADIKITTAYSGSSNSADVVAWVNEQTGAAKVTESYATRLNELFTAKYTIADNTVTETTNGGYAFAQAQLDKVAELTAKAETLKAAIGFDGNAANNAAAIDKELKEQIESVYTSTTAAQLTQDLEGTSEAQLLNGRINSLLGTTAIEIDTKKYAPVGSWITVANLDKYDDVKKEEVKAIADEAEDAIKAAKTIADADAAFLAAYAKYVAVPTIADRDKFLADNAKKVTSYKNDIAAYFNYHFTNLETGQYDSYANSTAAIAAMQGALDKCYTVEELDAKYAELKGIIDTLKTKTEVSAEIKALNAEIAAYIKGVTADDAEALMAIRDKVNAFNDRCDLTYEYGQNGSSAKHFSDSALSAYQIVARNAQVKAINDAYAAIKTVTSVDQKAAVEALRAQYDAYVDFYKDVAADTPITASTSFEPSNMNGAIIAFENDISELEIAAVVNAINALKMDGSDPAAVKAARAAYDALTYDQKADEAVVDVYNKLIAAEAAAAAVAKFTDADAKAYVQDLAIAVRTAKSGKKVKVTVNADVQTLIDNGYTVEYKFYKSTKKSSGYKNTVNKTTNTYTNTNPVKGKNYYKVKLVVKNADGTVVATTPLTQCKYGVRTMK